MEILLALGVVVVIGALIYFNRSSKGLDVNNDGTVDLADVALAAKTTVEGVKAAADVNKDGKVDVADVKAVTTKAKAGAKKAVAKTKETVKKASGRGRKPKAK